MKCRGEGQSQSVSRGNLCSYQECPLPKQFKFSLKSVSLVIKELKELAMYICPSFTKTRGCHCWFLSWLNQLCRPLYIVTLLQVWPCEILSFSHKHFTPVELFEILLWCFCNGGRIPCFAITCCCRFLGTTREFLGFGA